MRPVISIKQSLDKLASHSGLIHIGSLLHSLKVQNELNNLKHIHCIDPKFSHTDVLFAMIGLISIGKPDYDAIDIFRNKQDFFVKALAISGCPSSATIR